MGDIHFSEWDNIRWIREISGRRLTLDARPEGDPSGTAAGVEVGAKVGVFIEKREGKGKKVTKKGKN